MNDGYRLTTRAEEGLCEIVLYVDVRFGARVADRVLRSIEGALERLAMNPGIGHQREDLTSDDAVRSWSVGPTLIAYRHRDRPIQVLFIERGEVDWERMLGEQHR